MVRRLVAAFSFLLALGFQLSGIESLPLAVVLWGVALLCGLAALSTWSPIRDRLPLERGAKGWDSKVTEVTPSEKYPGMWALMFRLYGPEGNRADGNVTCEVTFQGALYKGEPSFDAYHLQPGELPHYVDFYPFRDAPREDGAYVLHWFETYALSRRLLTKPHRFKIRNGRVVGAKPE